MYKIGIDLAQISRMEQCLQNPRFMTRVFSKAEQDFLAAKKGNASSAAANFAAKEAFAKALGTGIRGFSLNEVSVLRHENGEPYLLLEGKAKEIAQERGLTFSVSLTHDGGMACAVVTAHRETAGLQPTKPERLDRLQKRFGADLKGITLLDPSFVKGVFPKRDPLSHKGSYGKLMILAGAERYRGAAALCTGAALRSGAGIVTLASVPPVIDAVSAKLYEPVYLTLPQNEAGTLSSLAVPLLLEQAKVSSALLIGCGLGQDEDVTAAVTALLENAVCPVVLDADGLNAIAGRIDILRTAKCRIIITPHLGEMSRLCGKSIAALQDDPAGAAKAFAERYGVTVVLKDADTVIASPDGSLFLNTTGNAGMARGGSGDVLAGMIAAFVCQGLSLKHAAACGVYLHGAAGDLAAAEGSMLGMLPSDMIEVLPKLYHFAEE
jgi:hydroxyethylthiazole kinase-like uncharacterized protein yjeF